MVPAASVLNFTPSSTALSGPESAVSGTAVLGKADTTFGTGVLGAGVLGAGELGAGPLGAGELVAGALTVKATPTVAGEPVPPATVAVIVLVYVPGPKPAGLLRPLWGLGAESRTLALVPRRRTEHRVLVWRGCWGLGV
jgi:hypothetical protein